MKIINKHFLIALLFLALSCETKTKKNYNLLHVTMKNSKSGKLFLKVEDGNKWKEIIFNDKGEYTDTLVLKGKTFGRVVFNDETYAKPLYLKKGEPTRIVFDGGVNNFELKEGAILENEYISELSKEASIIQEGTDPSDCENIDEKCDLLLKNSIKKSESLDSVFSKLYKEEVKNTIGVIKYLCTVKLEAQLLKQKMEEGSLSKGNPSPEFVNYENFKGKATSLSDFKGKYVYIDIWATWCGPCKKEIPYLKELEKRYHDKNIVFVSISMDAKADYETWKNMIAEKEMGGVQLFANEDQSFINAYGITEYPTFILVNPEGKIVTARAPKPSSPEMEKILGSLNLQ